MSDPDQKTTKGDKESKRRAMLQEAQAVWGPELYDIANIESYEWYLGMLRRSDIEPYLKIQGEFAVRAHDHRTYSELILSLRSATACSHITLICNSVTKEWGFTISKKPTSKVFATIPNLIEYYKKKFLPLSRPNHRVVLTVPCSRPKWVLKRSNLEVDKDCLLGSGNFCDVYKGKLNKRRVVAIKICHVLSADDRKSEKQVNREFSAREGLVREGHLMQSVQHWNVISFFGMCFDKPPVMIVMELCPGGSLVNHLVKFGNKITTGERLKFAQESADGMAFLHSKGCIHRDLAARNCLISKDGVVKIADFGLSKLISENTGDFFGAKQQIPIRWMAPESIQRDALFTDKSDVWSYGMLLYEIFNNGERPWEDWEGKKVATYIRKVRMPDFPAKTPPQIVELVKEKIWLLDPLKRENFEFIVIRLVQIVILYPYPMIEKLTVNEIPNVKALNVFELLDSKETTGDVTKTTGTSTASRNSTKSTISSKTGNVRERDLSIDESSPSVSSSISSRKRRKRSPSKRRVSRKSQRSRKAKSPESLDEQVTSSDDNDKTQKPKAPSKRLVQPSPAFTKLAPPLNPAIKTRSKRSFAQKSRTRVSERK